MNEGVHPLVAKLQEMGLKIPQWESLPKENGLGFCLEVVIKPGAKKESMKILPSGELSLSLRAPPVEGAANSALIETLSEIWGMAPRQIAIRRGEKSRHKKLAFQVFFHKNKNVDFYLQKLQLWKEGMDAANG